MEIETGNRDRGRSYKFLSVTAPSEAEAASLANLPRTPRVSPGPLGTKAAMRASNSSCGMLREMVFLTASISISSPF